MPKKNKDDVFRSKIPEKLHQPILEWYTCGMSVAGIMAKLKSENNLGFNPATVIRLLDHLKKEASLMTSAALAKQAQNQVVSDFEGLNNLKNDLEDLAKTSKSNDNNLYLRTVDRLVKVYQIKFSLTENNKSNDNSVDEEKVKESLLEKLGKL